MQEGGRDTNNSLPGMQEGRRKEEGRTLITASPGMQEGGIPPTNSLPGMQEGGYPTLYTPRYSLPGMYASLYCPLVGSLIPYIMLYRHPWITRRGVYTLLLCRMTLFSSHSSGGSVHNSMDK